MRWLGSTCGNHLASSTREVTSRHRLDSRAILPRRARDAAARGAVAVQRKSPRLRNGLGIGHGAIPRRYEKNTHRLLENFAPRCDRWSLLSQISSGAAPRKLGPILLTRVKQKCTVQFKM